MQFSTVFVLKCCHLRFKFSAFSLHKCISVCFIWLKRQNCLFAACLNSHVALNLNMNNHRHWKVTAHENFILHFTEHNCPLPLSLHSQILKATFSAEPLLALYCISRLRRNLDFMAVLAHVLWSLSFCLTYRSAIFQSFDGRKEQGLERSDHVTLDELTLKLMTQDCSSVKEQLLQLKTLLQVRYKNIFAYITRDAQSVFHSGSHESTWRFCLFTTLHIN